MLSQYTKQKLSFDMAAPSVLGASRSGAILMEMLTSETATFYRDVAAMHARVKQVIPDLPALASSYDYGRFKFADGSIEILGEPWIVASSIRAVNTTKLIITVDENVTADTEASVRLALKSNNIKFKLERIDS